MASRTATCSCRQLRVVCAREPERISVCHCLDCQKRTGAPFGAQARFARADVTIEGESATWSRAGDSGGVAHFHFCPVCGSTVYWEPEAFPDLVYVATGAFADPAFPAPTISVYDERGHPWIGLPDSLIRH